jgi:hypothetical protein
MIFSELRERAAQKKAGRITVIGATTADQSALQSWKKTDWLIREETGIESALEAAAKKETDLLCVFSDDPVKIIRAFERTLPKENGALVWLHGIGIAAYPKNLWAAAAPSAHYANIPEALKVVQQIIRALNGFGYVEPRIALLSCVEAISPGVPSTIWEAVLGHMGTRGQFGKAIVDGPLALDLAVSPHAAEDKKFKSAIGAQADAIMPPDLNSFLSFSSALFLTGEQESADIVIGAPCPIIITPSGLTRHTELSIAAASLLI